MFEDDLKSIHCLQLIQRSADYSRDLIEKFPKLEEDVFSFRTNPNCTCKQRLHKEFTEDPEKYLTFSKHWLENNEHDIDIQAVLNNENIKRNKDDIIAEKELRRNNKTTTQSIEELEKIIKDRTQKELRRVKNMNKKRKKRENESEEEYQKRIERLEKIEKIRKDRYKSLSENFQKRLDALKNKEEREKSMVVENNNEKKLTLQEKIAEKTKKYEESVEKQKAQEVKRISEKRNVIGEVVEIETNPQAYKDLIQYVRKQGWLYHGLDMMETIKTEEDGTEKTVWLVFFY